jgi:hypothetical protein
MVIQDVAVSFCEMSLYSIWSVVPAIIVVELLYVVLAFFNKV